MHFNLYKCVLQDDEMEKVNEMQNYVFQKRDLTLEVTCTLALYRDSNKKLV